MNGLSSEVDVIIIGAGGAGLTAALQMSDLGKKPLILEKMSRVRGNTKGASAGMNAAESIFQMEQGIEDSKDAFYEETLKGGKGTNQRELLRHFVDHSSEAISWLDQKGIRLDNLTQVGGLATKRTHRPTDGSPIGQYLMDHFIAEIEKRKIPILLQAEAKELVLKEDRVVAVKAVVNGREREWKTKAVIVTSGGFAANREWVAHYAPKYKGFVTTNYPSAKGEGLQLLQEAGAELIDLEKIQVHPTVGKEKPLLITEAVRGEGAILVNHRGKRFCNELSTRDKVSQAIQDLPEHSAYLIFDQGVRERVPAINFYASQGLVSEAPSIGELAHLNKIPRNECVKTVVKWNYTVETKQEDSFGRTTGREFPLQTPPYQRIEVVPGVHHTMGGVRVTTQAEVVRTDGSILKGCYAAGEVVGGLHGDNRIGGNAIAETVVFGRQAAKQAARFINSEVRR